MDSSKAGSAVSRMWLKLARQLSDDITDMVIAGEHKNAMKLATYAEACFWKATGEADTHDIKDVL